MAPRHSGQAPCGRPAPVPTVPTFDAAGGNSDESHSRWAAGAGTRRTRAGPSQAGPQYPFGGRVEAQDDPVRRQAQNRGGIVPDKIGHFTDPFLGPLALGHVARHPDKPDLPAPLVEAIDVLDREAQREARTGS